MGTSTGAVFKFRYRHNELTRKLEAGRDIAQVYSSGLLYFEASFDREESRHDTSYRIVRQGWRRENDAGNEYKRSIG